MTIAKFSCVNIDFSAKHNDVAKKDFIIYFTMYQQMVKCLVIL